MRPIQVSRPYGKVFADCESVGKLKARSPILVTGIFQSQATASERGYNDFKSMSGGSGGAVDGGPGHRFSFACRKSGRFALTRLF